MTPDMSDIFARNRQAIIIADDTIKDPHAR